MLTRVWDIAGDILSVLVLPCCFTHTVGQFLVLVSQNDVCAEAHTSFWRHIHQHEQQALKKQKRFCNMKTSLRNAIVYSDTFVASSAAFMQVKRVQIV